MNVEALYRILADTTVQLRKGDEVTERDTDGGLHVTEIFAMPHESEAPDGVVKVDCHFLTIGVNKAEAEKHRAELVEILKGYPQPDRLAGGPSYIEAGAELGDQGAAFQLFALGESLGLWKVITPAKLGFKGPEADQMAGGGLVMISGYKQ